MSNIYNLQQVSMNSRIVAVEGTFDHIDANNINIGIVTTDSLTVEEINAVDPVAGICINDRILVNEINEKTLTHGVEFPQKIRVDVIEEFTGVASVDFPNDLKTDFIAPSTGINVQIDDILNDQISTDEIILNANAQVLIQRPIAFVFTEEYGEFTFTWTAVAATYKEPASIGIVNAGISTYIPENLVSFRLTVPETGIYSFSIVAENTDILIDSSYSIRIIEDASSEVIAIGEHNTLGSFPVGDYHVHTASIARLTTGDVMKFQMSQIVGVVSSKDFSGRLYVSRIK